MADEVKKNASVFSGILDAINANKRKKSTINPESPGMGLTQTMPTLDPKGGVEHMQQQYLDWQVTKISHDLYTRTVYYDTDRISAYQDFRAMDGTPEIAAALNIIRDECLIYSLSVPLVCGKSLTIEKLYQQNYKNFEVYSYNPILKRHEPALCERIVYKGEQDCYKVTFDDDSYIETTSEHLWLKKGENEYIKTSDLKEGMSIEPLYTRISDEKDRINGYEMILENGKWEYTHRIVKRKFWPDEKGVSHHKDINKLNNESSNLQIMTWYDHQNLHHTLNSERWENNDEYSQKMRKIFSKVNSNEGPYWSNEEWKRNRIGEMSEVHRERVKNYTEEELKKEFGHPGEKNPMYNKGYKVANEKNGRFLEDVQREFSKEEIINAFKESFDIHDVCRLLKTKQRILNKSKSYIEIGAENLKKYLKRRNKKDFDYLNIRLIEDECQKHLGKIILGTQPSMALITNNLGWTYSEVKICLKNNGFKIWKDFVKQYNSTDCLLQNVKQKFVRGEYKSLKYFCQDENISINVVKTAIKRSKYKNLSGLLESANHKIKSVEYSGKYRTYDLVNVGEHNNFAVLTSDKKSGVFVHNCLTRSERGNILEVYSENKRVKQVLQDLFKNVLNVDFNLRLWIRDLVKYGDYFVMLQVDKEVGIYDFLTLPMEEVHREEGYDGRTSSVRFRWETTGDYFEEWQVAHFRLLEDSRKLPYGRSILDSSRKLWKQLQLAEDAMLVYRLCLDGETRIRTDNGYKYIKDIKNGDKVISYTPEKQYVFANVVNHVNNGVHKVLKVKSIHKEIICTETHPILVNENGVIKYVDAKDLVVKKHQLINTDTSDFNVQEKKIDLIFGENYAKLSEEQRGLFKNKKYKNISEIIRSCETDEYNHGRIKQFLYFEGKALSYEVAKNVCDTFDLQSDNLITLEKGQVNVERLNLPEFVDEEFAQLFGFLLGDGFLREHEVGFAEGMDDEVNKKYSDLLKKYFGKVKYQPEKRLGKKFGKYIVNSTQASKIFVDLGFISGAHNKRIPTWAFNSKKEIKKALVLGLCDADECIRKSRKGEWKCTVELCNKELIEDIKELWTSINLSSGILKSRNRKGGHVIDHESGRTMPDTVSFVVNLSQIELPEYENVISIEECGETEVYDITVDNDIHNFIANGTPVHNTRAPDRRIFYVEVGNIPESDIKEYIGKVQNQVRKQPIIDVKTGNMAQKYNPENVTEDYWIPIRGDKSSRVETLPGACLSLDTKIPLLDGRTLELQEIIKEYESGKELWAYSCNPETGEFVPGIITWAGVTRKNTQVIKLTLDNGETIIVTPDHKMLTKAGIKTEAQNLSAGDSLMPFNTKKEFLYKGISGYKKDYEMVYDNFQQEWIWTHRKVANYFKGTLCNEYTYKKDGKQKNVRHHKDFCRFNNVPSNIVFMSFADHMKLHSDMVYLASEAFSKKYKEDKDFAKKIRKNLEIGNKLHHERRNSDSQYKKMVDDNQKEGTKNYWENISEDELATRGNISRVNIKDSFLKFLEMLKDENYKKEFYKRTSASLKIVKNTPEYKSKQSGITKKQWETTDLRSAIKEKQTIKYSNNMLQFVVNRFKDGLSAEEILRDINSENSLFMAEFNSLNSNNKQLLKMKDGFTHNNLVKMMKSFGYQNWRDFKNKVELFNHKIVSIEWLDEKQDTGTITIDGNEMYHNFHTFALAAGVYNFNSNMDQIQDIEYLQNKLFAALQVPKTYLNYSESMPGGSTLSQADIRFSRTINSIQEAILLELRRIANVHLYFLGFEDDFENFQLTLTNPSTQQELLKLETMKARLEVFKEFFTTESTSPASYSWSMENVLGFSKSDIKLMLKQKKVEKKIFAEIDSSVETYKKIGLFDELDDRYEDPDAAAAAALNGTTPADDAGGGAGGGGGGGSILGGGIGGGIDMGAGAGAGEEVPGTEPGAEAGAEAGAETPGVETPEGEEEKEKPTTIKESAVIKHLKSSDRRMDHFINELLGPDEDIIKLMKEKSEREDNALTKKNKTMNIITKKLLESIDKSINSVKVEAEEDKIEENTSALLESNEENNNKTKAIFEDLDKITEVEPEIESEE